jgi:hypothetical protein
MCPPPTMPKWCPEARVIMAKSCKSLLPFTNKYPPNDFFVLLPSILRELDDFVTGASATPAGKRHLIVWGRGHLHEFDVLTFSSIAPDSGRSTRNGVVLPDRQSAPGRYGQPAFRAAFRVTDAAERPAAAGARTQTRRNHEM